MSAKYAIRLAFSLLCAGCAQQVPPGTRGIPTSEVAPPSFTAVATIQDVMRYEVDPSADAIWDSVGSITTAAGTVERQPRTAAEWATLRRDAVVLVEATNLLVIPGRQVSITAFAADGPGVFSSAEIQQRLTGHHAEFQAFALALRGTALKILAAIDAKDPATLGELGEAMDGACEACHLANWYPHEIIPQLPTNPLPAR